MSIGSTTSRNTYVGDGLTSVYPYSFKIFSNSDLYVQKQSPAGVVTDLILTTDYTVSGAGNSTGGAITLTSNLTNLFKLLIRRIRPLTQNTTLSNEAPFYPNIHENTFDKLVMNDQQLQEQLSRSIKLAPTTTGFDPTLPPILVANRTLVVGPTGTDLALGPTPAELAAAAGDAGAATAAALAAQADAAAALLAAEAAQDAADAAALTIRPGGLTGQVLRKASDVDFDTEWGVGFDDTLYSRSGFSARFGSNFSSTNLGDTLDKIILLQYAGPLVSLSASGSGTIREKGTPVAASNLTASVTKRSNNIAAVRFYKDAVLINTVASPNPGGGNEVYSWSGSFSDQTTFSTQVDDVAGGGGPTQATSGVTFNFVYPYFVGAGAPGLSASAVAALTKLTISSNASLNRSITATSGQVFYFAYPASYGALTSILDVNNFEVFPDWTLSTSNITGLDGSAQSYRIYQFNNPVVAGSYSFTFKR